MSPEEIGRWLDETLEDQTLSRGERQDFAEKLTGLEPASARQAVLRLAFELARKRLDSPILGWLEEVTRSLCAPQKTAASSIAEAHFSPGDDCLGAIQRLLHQARRTADICVFTITDDRVSESILDAHRRKVAVRIVTDNEKADDLGSDISHLEAAGIPVRVDRTAFHMHHKFAVLDGKVLLTGSYNWTRGAARDNEENFVVSDDPRLVTPFEATFERLWRRLS